MSALVLIDFHKSLYKVFFLLLSQLRIQILPSTYLIQSNSRPVNRQTLHQEWSGKYLISRPGRDLPIYFQFHYSHFSLNPIRKDLQHFFYRILEQNSQMFRIQNKIKQTSPFFCSKKNGQVCKTKKIGYVNPFPDEATPGFELGKRDLQSPALPLGHAAKTIQNI